MVILDKVTHKEYHQVTHLEDPVMKVVSNQAVIHQVDMEDMVVDMVHLDQIPVSNPLL